MSNFLLKYFRKLALNSRKSRKFTPVKYKHYTVDHQENQQHPPTSGHSSAEDESQPLFDSEDPNMEVEEKENSGAGDGGGGGKAELHLWAEKYAPKRFTDLLSDDVSLRNSVTRS